MNASERGVLKALPRPFDTSGRTGGQGERGVGQGERRVVWFVRARA